MKICNDSCDSIHKDMQVYVGGLNFGGKKEGLGW